MPKKRIKAITKIKNPWEVLTKAIDDTLSERDAGIRLTTIMQACNDLVTKSKLDDIYNELQSKLNNQFNRWHDELSNAAGDPLINKLSKQYDYFKCLRRYRLIQL